MTGFFAGVVILLAVLFALYWRWSTRINEEIAEGAAIEWKNLQQTDPTIIEGYDEASFQEIYRRVHFPRFPKYALAAFTAFATALPFVLTALSALFWAGEAFGVIATPSELSDATPISGAAVIAAQASREDVAMYLAQDYFGFFFFFGVLGSWLSIVAIVMHRYHSRRPGYLRDELIRGRL